jgi:hypothetical protein
MRKDENIIIKGTKTTPEVRYDDNIGNNTIRIDGESNPENALSFYSGVISLIEKHIEENQKLNLKIKLIYFNTSSAKMLVRLFDLLDSVYQTGKADIGIVWEYDKEDDDMEEAGDELLNGYFFQYEMVGV